MLKVGLNGCSKAYHQGLILFVEEDNASFLVIELKQTLFNFYLLRKMSKIERILELLRTVIIFTIDNTVKINKDTIADIQKCIQNAQEKI